MSNFRIRLGSIGRWKWVGLGLRGLGWVRSWVNLTHLQPWVKSAMVPNLQLSAMLCQSPRVLELKSFIVCSPRFWLFFGCLEEPSLIEPASNQAWLEVNFKPEIQDKVWLFSYLDELGHAWFQANLNKRSRAFSKASQLIWDSWTGPYLL